MSRKLAHLKLPAAQSGLSLMELMVGLTIGLLVSAAAMGTLMFMQSFSRESSDLARMQQDATLAFNTISRYVRSSGSVNLTTNAQGAVSLVPLTDFNGVDNNGIALDGISASQFRMASSLPNNSGINGAQLDCLGRTVSGPLLITQFDWNAANQELRCVGLMQGEVLNTGGVSFQPIVANVAQFVVHYGLLTPTGLQYRSFANGLDWSQLVALRVCMVLTSQASIPAFRELYVSAPALAFQDCDASDALTIDRNTILNDPQRRLHRTYRQTIQLRLSGL
jgi:type IV pilus assembly protein PilW